MRATTGIALVAGLQLVAGGCAHDLVVGDPEPSGSRLVRPVGLEAVTPQDWPDACRLLTDEEIHALLPESQGLERHPSPVTILDVDFLDGQDVGGEAAHGSCDYLADHGNGDFVEIGLTIEAVGKSAVIRAAYAAERSYALENKSEYDTVRDVEGTAAKGCFRSGDESYSTLYCRHRWLMFSVNVVGVGTVPDASEDDMDQVLTERLAPRVVQLVVAKVD
jgi:hypothetical protein